MVKYAFGFLVVAMVSHIPAKSCVAIKHVRHLCQDALWNFHKGEQYFVACSAEFMCAMCLPFQPIMFICFVSMAYLRRVSLMPHAIKVFEGFGKIPMTALTHRIPVFEREGNYGEREKNHFSRPRRSFQNRYSMAHKGNCYRYSQPTWASPTIVTCYPPSH